MPTLHSECWQLRVIQCIYRGFSTLSLSLYVCVCVLCTLQSPIQPFTNKGDRLESFYLWFYEISCSKISFWCLYHVLVVVYSIAIPTDEVRREIERERDRVSTPERERERAMPCNRTGFYIRLWWWVPIQTISRTDGQKSPTQQCCQGQWKIFRLCEQSLGSNIRTLSHMSIFY